MTITALQSLPHAKDEPVLSGRTPHRPLSPREKQIFDLVNGGHTRKEVAFELELSDVTVRVLYSRAMAKLGRAKRAWARRSKLFGAHVTSTQKLDEAQSSALWLRANGHPPRSSARWS